MMHEGSRHLNVVDPIVATVIACGSDGSQGLSSKDREDLSNLYLKFVDYCGTTHDIRKAWNRHIKSFPHLIRSTSSNKPPSNQLSNVPEEIRESIPRLVAKKPTMVRGIEHIPQISADQNQAIEPRDATANQHGGNHEENAAREIESVSAPNELKVSQIYDQIRREPEKEHEVEMANQNPDSATESAKKQNETDQHRSESLSFSPSHRNLHEQTKPQQIPSQNPETCLTPSKDANLESDGKPRLHPRDSPLVQQSTADQDRPNPTNENTENNTRPVQNTDQPVQPMVQYPVQNTEQSGLVQNGQSYNQMWQYQYQYQQQQQQNQQQWLQMQQQSYLIQQQQQFQPQQYQAYRQQQDQYQQYMYQMYQQQQQEQGNQQLYQQQQQQMQEYMWMQQYQQQMQQQMPQDFGQNQQQHQIAAMSNQMWNGGHDQQGQATMPPHPTTAHVGFETSYKQQNTANVVAQPTNVGSPSNRQPSSHGASSIPSKSLHSPSVEQS